MSPTCLAFLCSHDLVHVVSYWWPDASAPHGIMNLSNPIPPDETLYISDSFDRFLDGLNGRPFVGQLAFHNCHIVRGQRPLVVANLNECGKHANS